jgi:hypothetical protein
MEANKSMIQLSDLSVEEQKILDGLTIQALFENTPALGGVFNKNDKIDGSYLNREEVRLLEEKFNTSSLTIKDEHAKEFVDNKLGGKAILREMLKENLRERIWPALLEITPNREKQQSQGMSGFNR